MIMKSMKIAIYELYFNATKQQTKSINAELNQIKFFF